MSPQHHNSSDSTVNIGQKEAGSNTKPSAHLAHELANLLDGSLRNLGLVIENISTLPQGGDDLMPRLQATSTAMQQMAQLVHRWLDVDRGPDTGYQQRCLLTDAIAHAVLLLSPAAVDSQIDIRVNLDTLSRQLPVGPVYPVIVNALRNSIEAIQRSTSDNDVSTPQIEVIARVTKGIVELIVNDTGSGIDSLLIDDARQFVFGKTTKTHGYGLGLPICRDIADELDGSVQLIRRHPGGASFLFTYPLSRVLDQGQ